MVFVNIPLIEVEVPEEAMPVRLTVLSLVQLNVVPKILFGLVITIGVIASSEHKV